MRTTLAIVLAWFCITVSTVYGQPGSGAGGYGSVGPGGVGGGPTNGLTGPQVGTAIQNTNNNDIIPRFAITNNYVRNQNGVVTNTLSIGSGNPVASTNVAQVDTLATVKALEVGTNGNVYIGNPNNANTMWIRGNLHNTGTTIADSGFSGDGAALINLEGTAISSGTLPITAADTSWMPLTNAVAFTNGPPVAGQALVIVGTNSYGAVLTKGTNWPTGGVSQTPWAQNINAATFGVQNVGLFWMTNLFGVSPTTRLTFTNNYDPVYGSVLTIAGRTNDVASQAGITVDNVVAGTVVANGGPTSFIPTNAAPVLTVNGATPSMPWGITNLQTGRVQPVVQYFMVDGASGTPIMTISNETTGVKLRISEAPLASLVQTNFFILPITTTNTIWKVRDESTGSGASVGVITNWFIGL